MGKEISDLETNTHFKCAKKYCDWKGTKENRGVRQDEEWNVIVCPKCGSEEFYGVKQNR